MKPNIFEYTDYRTFLKESYDYLKETKPGFSHRYFAKRAGLSSPGCLYKVVKGERNLSKDNIQKFSLALGLTKKEQQYFDMLVSFNNAKSPETKRYYLELLYNIKKKKSGVPLTDKQFEYYSNWYYPTIRELIGLPDFNEDPNWIRARLGNKITNKQVKTALDVLLRLGLARRDTDGSLKQCDAIVTTEEEVMHTAAGLFHKQMLGIADETLFVTPPEHREIAGITMAVSNKQFKEIQSKMRDFYSTIMNYLNNNSDVPETVMQMHLMFFPLIDNKNGRVE